MAQSAELNNTNRWNTCISKLTLSFINQAWELAVKKQISAAVKLTPWREKIVCGEKKLGVKKRKNKKHQFKFHL